MFADILATMRLWLLAAAPTPATDAPTLARAMLGRAAAAGRTVPADISGPILAVPPAPAAGQVLPDVEDAFNEAYTRLAQLTADLSKRAGAPREYPFEEALEDAELLLKYAAESGIAVDAKVADAILGARTAFKANTLTDELRGSFYASYAVLSKTLGDVTAETIRHCSAPGTGRALRRDKFVALFFTAVVASISVVTFVADSGVKAIGEDIAHANDLAARLRVGLAPADGSAEIPPALAGDPCGRLAEAPGRGAKVQNVADVTTLQDLAATIRALQSRAIKLNGLLRAVTPFQECNAFAETCDADHTDEKAARRAMFAPRLQLSPAILNYPAETLCRIITYQEVRSFATNVRDNYTSIIGAVTSYAIPIFYAVLGAYAFRLRLFADTIRKRTYHPSFSDSARMITAVIAGAISGLFNPAQGLTLSPLAVAFLVGYGVELFFRFLDTLVNAFGIGKPAK